MKKIQKVAVYYRTNHPNNMKLFINSVSNLSDNTLVFIDYASGVENQPALNKLLNLVQNKKLDVIITDSHASLVETRSWNSFYTNFKSTT